ncbi:MAG: hypothetical protein KJ804_17025 [Proteobacteria bacterium]|nr:hypothetical protein [Pseudomonadota bacterium]MBU1060009.1 hypothetical protein [Pseudomonadota bacterium]
MDRGSPLSLSLLVLVLLCNSCFADTEIFTIRNRPANEILPVVRAALSPEGRAVADNIGNMIIVNDSAEAIDTIRVLLLSSDQKMIQVTVQMAAASSAQEQARAMSSGGKKTGRHLSTENSHFPDASSSQTRKSRSFVTVSSDSSGYIRMAEEIQVSEKWSFFCRQYGVPLLLQGTRTIETGMEITPVATGTQVIVTIIPRISWIMNGRANSFRFVDAATRLTIPRSQWITLGEIPSFSKTDSDILSTILSTSEFRTKDDFTIQIKADINK